MVKGICFVGGGLQGGGQERALSNLANHYSSQGYEIALINLFKTDVFYELDNRIKVIWPKIDRTKHKRLAYALMIVPYLRRTIRRTKPDVIISFGEWFNPFVILSTRLLNVPVYVFDRMGPEMRLDPLIQYSRKILYRYASGVIVQTTTAASIVAQKTGAKNIVVIPNPVNPVSADISHKEKRIITVGRLSPEKGHSILIRAFSRLENKDWQLFIVGDGSERPALEREASSLGVSGRVKFLGHLKEFSSVLGESEVFVLPSFHEGFPNALLEAMSVPLACISSDCVAGPGEIIKNGVNGLLVKPGDEEEFAKAIERLIIDPEMRHKLAAEAYKVRETFNIERIAGRITSFIDNGYKTSNN